ncbi:ABC transporter permease [Pigmentiphaga sp. H8]|uniref:ABC transporter permease n=1 Tax=Pigmentiphaga sp. H8 TaxID=2488560 RepID=UPI0018648A2A|nr:ABC transporter permease [Pigmentiphaga sp. H8]
MSAAAGPSSHTAGKSAKRQARSGVFLRAAGREAAWLRRHPRELAMISWVPLLAVLLLWWMFSAGIPTRLPIAIVDDDHSALSRQLARMLEAAPGLRIARRDASLAEARAGMERGDTYAVVAIERDFSRDIKRGASGHVTLYHNAQFYTVSGLVLRDVQTVAMTLSAGVEMAARNRRGEPARAVAVNAEPIRPGSLALFNPSLNYEQFLAAALIPALLHILGMTAGAWAVGREIRDRTVGAWLAAATGAGTAPDGGVRIAAGPALAALAGKLAWPWTGLSGVGLAALLWLTWGRGWHPPGSLPWVALALVAFMALSIAMGAAAALATRSLRTALSLAGVVTAPAFAFSGMGFPLAAMPVGARAWALALPYTHYIRLQVEQLQMAAPLRQSLPAFVSMPVGTALLALAGAWLLCRVAAEPARWGGR